MFLDHCPEQYQARRVVLRMALSSPLRQGRVSFLERLGKMLHVHYDNVLNEPVPQRWADLIKYLNAKEQAEAPQSDDAPGVRRPRPRSR